jgi:hypothetical protein
MSSQILNVYIEDEFNYVYKEPKLLCNSSGLKWNYQWISEDIFSEPIKLHFDSWKRSSTDETTHPIILALSGPGTGKSRFLDELPVLLKKYSDGQEYKKHI